MQGVCRLHTPNCSLTPSWDLVTVLDAITRAPFEPLQDVELKVLSLKAILLVVIAGE